MSGEAASVTFRAKGQKIEAGKVTFRFCFNLTLVGERKRLSSSLINASF